MIFALKAIISHVLVYNENLGIKMPIFLSLITCILTKSVRLSRMIFVLRERSKFMDAEAFRQFGYRFVDWVGGHNLLQLMAPVHLNVIYFW